LIASDLGRMVALLTIPAAFGFGLLRMEQLYVVGLVVGVFNVFFGISYQSYLPALIARADLVEGNSKLEVSRSTAQLAGPAIAGFAIQAIGSVGGLLGAIASSAVVARLGVGLTLLLSIFAGGLIMATPLAAQTNAPVFLSALFFFEFLIGAPYNITQVSLRQAITPDRVQG